MIEAGQSRTILIKRYGADRLYDAQTGRYVSSDEVRAWVRAAIRGEISLQVLEARTNVDVTSDFIV